MESMEDTVDTIATCCATIPKQTLLSLALIGEREGGREKTDTLTVPRVGLSLYLKQINVESYNRHILDLYHPLFTEAKGYMLRIFPSIAKKRSAQ